MDLNPEYIEYLENEVEEFDKELISILELPSVENLRARIKKDKRDTRAMLRLYKRINLCNKDIRCVKGDIRSITKEARKQLNS